VFENAAAGKRFFEGVTGKRPGGAEGLVYSRFNGPNQEILEDRLSLWEDAEDALTFSSGMSAIATLLLTFVQPGDVIVHSGPLYAATETLIGRILGRFGITWLDFPAGSTQDEIAAVIDRAKAQGRLSLIYLESPANPTNALVDVEAVRAARDAAFGEGERPPIAIDNTSSARSGSSRCATAPTSPSTASPNMRRAQRPRRRRRDGLQGADQRHPPDAQHDRHDLRSQHAWMLLRSLETLELRMTRAGENAAKVCEFFRTHPKVESVGYLGFLEQGSDARQATSTGGTAPGAGSTFSLYLKGGEKEAFAFLDALKIAKLAVSLGGTETLASHPAGMTHLSVPQERKDALKIGDNLVRISIGVEDADDLIADFDQALAAV
jgi:methionine-gamma-lyase